MRNNFTFVLNDSTSDQTLLKIDTIISFTIDNVVVLELYLFCILGKIVFLESDRMIPFGSITLSVDAGCLIKHQYLTSCCRPTLRGLLLPVMYRLGILSLMFFFLFCKSVIKHFSTSTGLLQGHI